MKRSITRWITTLSTAATLGMPAMVLAQTPEPQTPPQQQTPPRQTRPEQTPPSQPPAQAQPTAPDSDKAVTPEEHLRQAKAAFEKIQPASLTGKARTQVAELKRHLTTLEGIGAAKPADATQGKTAREAATWGTEAAAIDKILAELLGDATTGTAGTAAVPGTAGGSKPATTAALDETTRAALMDVRKHIVAYAAGMAEKGAPKGEAAMTPQPQAATPSEPQPTTPSEPQPTTPSEPQPATPSQPQPAPTPEQPPAATPSAATPSAAPAQVDQEAARRHLTTARDTLSQLTKIPAAAQLTGENRTQVTQLIANFNELITTQSQWRASYDKVAANLNALLGPGVSGAAPDVAAATPATPAGTPPEPGAVGTSGVANADLDPAIRAKLVELRSNLAEFEKAMGAPAAQDKNQ